MDLRIFSLVLLFLLFPYFECGPTKSRKIGGKNDLTPKPESIDDGYSTTLVNGLGVVVAILLTSNIVMIAYLATRKTTMITTERNNQSVTPADDDWPSIDSGLPISEDILKLRPLVQALLASETEMETINLTESIYNSVRGSASNCYSLCYILQNHKKFITYFLKLLDAEETAIICNCTKIAYECSRKHYPNLYMIERKTIIVQSGLIDSIFKLLWSKSEIETLSIAASVLNQCIDVRTANINPDTIKQILKIMAATINETASAEKLSMLKDINRITFCLLTETESKRNHAEYAEIFIKEGGIWTYLDMIRSRTQLHTAMSVLFFNTIQRALASAKNADDAEMETIKRGGWHLAIQLVSKLVREWDLYMYRDVCWEFLEEPAFLIARLIQERDGYSAYSEIAKFESFKNDVHNLVDSLIAILDRAATALETNSGHEIRTKYAASNMCKAIRHVSDRLTAHTQNNLMSNPNAVKVVECLVRLMKKGLHEFDIRPIDVENTTYEAILSVLQLATADENGAESVIQHYDQLIIVSMTRPIDSPKDKRKRDIDTKIGFWKRVGKSGAREKEECSIM